MRPPIPIDPGQWDRFVDEILREKAVAFAEHLLSTLQKPVDRHQLFSIPIAIQAGGLKELTRLAEKQSEKEESKNKEFWAAIKNHIGGSGAQDKESLYHTARGWLSQAGKIEDEERISDSIRRKQVQKQNRDHIKAVLDAVLKIYFEHFRCHYSYGRWVSGKGTSGRTHG